MTRARLFRCLPQDIFHSADASQQGIVEIRGTIRLSSFMQSWRTCRWRQQAQYDITAAELFHSPIALCPEHMSASRDAHIIVLFSFWFGNSTSFFNEIGWFGKIASYLARKIFCFLFYEPEQKRNCLSNRVVVLGCIGGGIGGPHGPSPPLLFLGGLALPLLNFEFCLNIVSLSNTIGMGPVLKQIL